MKNVLEDHVEEVVVLVEAETEKHCMDMLDLLEGGEAFKKAFLYH